MLLSKLAAAFAILCLSVPAGAAPSSHDTLIPARTLRCTLGHALNLDPAKEQRMDEIEYEGSHEFALFLPATILRTGPPPEATDPAEPVDAATRILSDPSGLRRDAPPGFDRVVDLWPQRVEMTQTIKRPLVHFIIINQIDEANQTANLFMTTAPDIAAMNLKTVYQGPCRITLTPARNQSARR